MESRFKVRVRVLREKQLLSMAEKMLATRGCEKFSTEELAKSVGVSKGTVYTHYASQRLLIEAVLARVSENLLSCLKDSSAARARDKLVATISRIADEIAAVPKGRLAYPCCLRLSPCPCDGTQGVLDFLRTLIEESAREGAIGYDIDAGLAARCFQHLLSAAVNDAGDPTQSRRDLLAVSRLYVNGLLAGPAGAQ